MEASTDWARAETVKKKSPKPSKINFFIESFLSKKTVVKDGSAASWEGKLGGKLCRRLYYPTGRQFQEEKDTALLPHR